ncbi:MAG: DNA-3-methyladenine glycosylase [Sphingobacteriales bacterium]|nr:DNA-3-methyladenine glycosylase [Sphingobacteriales bacterium]OJW32845.1 MAG: 3-methyladenine DNA glycosylase [Sphingobacteriales bacterium 46-32]
MPILPYSFYRRPDVLQVAADLMGKLLVTRWNAVVTSGRIVECEAYAGIGDRASHAFGGRRTARNEPMYAAGGRSYVYLCYGIHHLFNVVTNEAEIPHAILIRALEPVEGVEEMRKRVGKPRPDPSLTRGPGNLSKALGIVTAHSNLSLKSAELFIADDGYRLQPGWLAWSPRIGVDYAGEDALLPYRLYVKGNVYVSGRPR